MSITLGRNQGKGISGLSNQIAELFRLLGGLLMAQVPGPRWGTFLEDPVPMNNPSRTSVRHSPVFQA